MKDCWLDDEAGYPEGGFPFSIITVCVSFFFFSEGKFSTDVCKQRIPEGKKMHAIVYLSRLMSKSGNCTNLLFSRS